MSLETLFVRHDVCIELLPSIGNKCVCFYVIMSFCFYISISVMQDNSILSFHLYLGFYFVFGCEFDFRLD